MEDTPDRTVLITGGSGFTGRRLARHFKTIGWDVRTLSRTPSNDTTFRWDIEKGIIEPRAMEGVSAVVHLAGEPIANGRWTRTRRSRIMESRIRGTRLIVSAMKSADIPPSVLVSASGVNAYGLAGKMVDENSPYGDGFLAEVCREWETEALRAREAGIRTVCLRTGIVLDRDGGVLKKLLPVFRFGLGGRIGSGRQGFPWIALEDLLGVYQKAVQDERLSGFVNAVHPQPTDQEEFARTLAKTLRRPLSLPLPAPVVRAIFGQMGEETLLADLRVLPGVLNSTDFSFKYDSLQQALSGILKVQFPCDHNHPQ